VVAREMRALADRTSQSAGQILVVTGSIHRSTKETASSIQEALHSTQQHPEIKHLMSEAIEDCMSMLREAEASHILLLSQSKSQVTSIEALQKEWSDLHASTGEFRHDAAEFHKHGERALVLAEELQRELRAFGSALQADVDAIAAKPRAGLLG
jgi:methyl-accepting chemotaxis protein